MNAGSPKTSRRLRATIKAIRNWRTTLGISKITGSMAVHSDIAALRANGICVKIKYIGMTTSKNRIYAYRLA